MSKHQNAYSGHNSISLLSTETLDESTVDIHNIVLPEQAVGL